MQLPKTDYLRIYSDIHLDFDLGKRKFRQFSLDYLWFPEQLDTDKNTTLILAGDIWHAKKTYSYANKSYIKELSKRFQYILLILGNHDLWGGNISHEYSRFKNAIIDQDINNVFLLQNDTIHIGNHKFIGATLWTDFYHGDTKTMEEAKKMMSDYKYIRHTAGYTKIRPNNLLGEHLKSKNYIFQQSKRDFPEQKIWILSHHAPSIKSIDEDDIREDTYHELGAYYSDLEKEILASELDFWIHGHLHTAKDYMIGDKRIITNPRGYPGDNSGYNPWFLLDLNAL